MKIAALQKFSTVDYPGKMAAVVFTQGCNMNCGFCHNQSLIGCGVTSSIPCSEVLSYLHKRKNMLEAVVVSGGEPTLQHGLEDFITTVKNMGYFIKLDTNGTNPDLLKDLLSQKLLDFVAMDIKAPKQKYQQICGTNVNYETIRKSIDLLQKSKIEYEFRTTFAPELTQEDVSEIATSIQGAEKFVLQQYRPVKATNEKTNTTPIARCIVSEVRMEMAQSVQCMAYRGEFALV